MNRPQRHGVTEKLCGFSLCLCDSVALLLCDSVALLLCASFASAAPLVHVGKLDLLHFKSRALAAERTVRVWLPPEFTRRARYSVLYLNDGQNLFGDGDPDSGGGGWHVDETAARLIDDRAIEPLIVVGIDHGGDAARSVDYLPVPDPFSEAPEPPGADRYLTFVIDELIPFINRKYPTRRGPEHTGFGGSSYGAASAFYAVMSHPDVFGRVLLESPSVGVGNGVLLDHARTVTRWPERVVMGIGSGEGQGRSSTASGRAGPGPGSAFQTLVELLRSAGLGENRLKVVVQDGGRHNEESWASRFHDALAFLFRRSPTS
jgi:enterochelin esterase-like enzyme